MARQTFPKSARLRRSAEFDRVYQGDQFAADQCLVIKAIDNGQSATRLGLSVSRKVGNAVVRNRWKRVIREAFRCHRQELPTGLDLVVRPKRGAQCNYEQVQQSLLKLTHSLRSRLDRG